MKTGNRGSVWRKNNPEKAKAQARLYYLKHKEKKLDYNYEWKKNHPEFYLWHSAKNRAKQAGLDFLIVIEDIIIPEICPIFGVPFLWKDKKFAPSLDRIDNSVGYIKGNIQVISVLGNRMKNNATKEELHNFAKWITNA